MATVLDSFVVEVGLDPTKFTEGEKKIIADLSQTKQAALETAKDIEASGKRAAQFFSRVKLEALSFFAALAGASGLKEFVQQTVVSEANVGRLAKNLGVATEELSVWEGVTKRMGGTAQDADSALSSLVETYNSIVFQGDQSKVGLLTSLGLSPQDLANPTEALLKLAKAAERMPGKEFAYKARMLGIPDSVISTLQKGRSAVSELVDEQKKVYVVSQQNTEEAQKLQEAWERASQSAKGFGSNLLHDLSPTLVKIADNLADVFGWLNRIEGLHREDRTVFDWSQIPNWLGGRSGLWFGSGSIVNPSARSPESSPLENWFPSMAPTSTSGAGQIETELMKRGLTPDQARGVAAGISAESANNPNAVNPTSGAYGYGQWLGPRKAALTSRYGENPSWSNQLDFLVWELMGGDHGGKSVLSGNGASDIASRYITDFMRPAKGAETRGDLARANAYLKNAGMAGLGGGGGGAPSVTLTGPVTINTRATDAKGLAADLGLIGQSYISTSTFNRGVTP